MEGVEKESKKARLGLRIDPALHYRLDDAVHEIKREARSSGQRVTKDSVIQDAIRNYLDLRERRGEKTAMAGPVKASIYAKLKQMEGMLKDVYKELGGAERAIQEEREGYSRRARASRPSAGGPDETRSAG